MSSINLHDFAAPENAGLWVVDLQEKLFALIDRKEEILKRILFTVKAAQMTGIPLCVTEQYPAGLGPVIPPLKSLLSPRQNVYSKTSFSGYQDAEIRKKVDLHETWILVGIEAHICVLQTAKDLLKHGKKVIILKDAVGSRFPVDFISAIEELSCMRARISTAETIVCEWIRDAKHPLFKKMLPLIKGYV